MLVGANFKGRTRPKGGGGPSTAAGTGCVHIDSRGVGANLKRSDFSGSELTDVSFEAARLHEHRPRSAHESACAACP